MNTQTHRAGIQTKVNLYWLDVLNEYNVKHMALDPVHDKKLIEQLNNHPTWIVEYASVEAVFFIREEMPVGKGIT